MNNTPLDEIRQALDAATKGADWANLDSAMCEHTNIVEEYDRLAEQGCDLIATCKNVEVAHLIANTPTWLSSLLEDNERITKENERLKQDRDYWFENSQQERDLSRRQKDRLREELEQVKKERDSLPTQWAYDQACKALWKHRDDAETLRSELEQVKKERDDWKYQLEFMSNTAWQDALDSVAVKNEILSLRSELAAKDKVHEHVRNKMVQLKQRIENRQGPNYHDESKKLLLLEGRLDAYEEIESILERYARSAIVPNE